MGRKLRSTSCTLVEPLATPATGVLQLEYTSKNVKKTVTTYNGNLQTTSTWPLKGPQGRQYTTIIYNSEGYVKKSAATIISAKNAKYTYSYYRRDHLGNNVALWDATNDTTVQRTFYYASGLPMSCSTGQSAQSRKYNGKEYVEDHGFDVYDYGFRGYYATIGRFTSIDPLAEQTPWQSPYVYANNNFINNIDYWGLAAIGSTVGFHSNIFPVTTLNWVAVDDDGNVVGWGDDEDDNHVYLVDEYWDGTYAGLGGYEMIGWEIPVGENGRTGILGYQKGQPCYYLGSYVITHIGQNGWTFTGSTRLMYGNTPVTTTIDNSFAAVWHYYFGNGEPIALGGQQTSKSIYSNDTIKALLQKGTMHPYYHTSTDFTSNIFHIGRTPVHAYTGAHYIVISCGAGDGFWDPDCISEHLFNISTDGKGPELEYAGTPYDYIPFVIFKVLP